MYICIPAFQTYLCFDIQTSRIPDVCLNEVNLSLADIVHIVFMQTEAIFAVCVALRNR